MRHGGGGRRADGNRESGKKQTDQNTRPAHAGGSMVAVDPPDEGGSIAAREGWRRVSKVHARQYGGVSVRQISQSTFQDLPVCE